jgi:hypothetical protein
MGLWRWTVKYSQPEESIPVEELPDPVMSSKCDSEVGPFPQLVACDFRSSGPPLTSSGILRDHPWSWRHCGDGKAVPATMTVCLEATSGAGWHGSNPRRGRDLFPRRHRPRKPTRGVRQTLAPLIGRAAPGPIRALRRTAWEPFVPAPTHSPVYMQQVHIRLPVLI